MKFSLLIACLLVAFSVLGQAHPIEAVWFNGEKTSRIKIYKASNNLYYGKIVWMKEPTINGKDRTDMHNPSESLRHRPLMNLVIFKDFKASDSDDNTLEGGTIYDPKTGKTYCGKITVENKKLRLKGYICGLSLFSRSTVWDLAD